MDENFIEFVKNDDYELTYHSFSSIGLCFFCYWFFEFDCFIYNFLN